MTHSWLCTLEGRVARTPTPLNTLTPTATRFVDIRPCAQGERLSDPLARGRRCLASGGVRRGRQGGEGGGEEPGVEEVVELLAADFLGEGHEVLGGGVAVVEAGGPGAQDG